MNVTGFTDYKEEMSEDLLNWFRYNYFPKLNLNSGTLDLFGQMKLSDALLETHTEQYYYELLVQVSSIGEEAFFEHKNILRDKLASYLSPLNVKFPTRERLNTNAHFSTSSPYNRNLWGKDKNFIHLLVWDWKEANYQYLTTFDDSIPKTYSQLIAELTPLKVYRDSKHFREKTINLIFGSKPTKAVNAYTKILAKEILTYCNLSLTESIRVVGDGIYLQISDTPTDEIFLQVADMIKQKFGINLKFHDYLVTSPSYFKKDWCACFDYNTHELKELQGVPYMNYCDALMLIKKDYGL